MAIVFKTEEEYFDAMWSSFTGSVPEVTNKTKGGVAWGLFKAAAYGLRLATVVIEKVYRNIYPQMADLQGNRNWAEAFNVAWPDNPSLEEARALVLGQFRAVNKFTLSWFGSEAAGFSDGITHAFARPWAPNIMVVVVLYNGADVHQTTLDALQGHFDDADNHEPNQDVRVVNISEWYEMNREYATTAVLSV